MNTIHSLFEAHVQQMPDAIAAIVENQFITYDELNKKANRLAYYLREKGLQPDTSVAICLERSIELLIIMLAILKAGGAYVPLDVSHPKERLLFILRDTNAPFLFTTSNLKDVFSDYQGSLIMFDKSEKYFNKYSDHNPGDPGLEKNLAYIIYTSGSTGHPKGVLIEHVSVVNYCNWFADYADIKSKQRIDFSSNYIFDMAITTSIIPLLLGLTIVICQDKTKKNLKRYLKYLQSNDINIIKMTPSYLKALASEAKGNDIALPYLHTLILGGENLHVVDCRAWLDVYPNHTIYNEYGPTETTVGVSSYKITSSTLSQLEVNAPIGIADKNVSFYLLDDEQNPVTDGEIGELYIGGVCLARGYLNQPALTNEKFIENPFSKHDKARLYRTGDLCRQLLNGALEYFGRVDQQVKINGFRIQLEEIEQCLVAHPDIKDVTVLVKENFLHEKQLAAYYIPTNENVPANASYFRQYLQERLPNYMIPTAFVWVDSFPRTSNDKLDPTSLPAPQFSRVQHYIAPRTQLEKSLADIWSEALGLNPIGIKDNFFELGGHSLTAARIVSKIEQVIQKEISLEDLYHAPTIRELVSVIRQTKDMDKTVSRNELVQKKSSVIPLNDFQFMLWIGDIVDPEVGKLNIVGRKRLKGQIDIIKLYAAFDALIKKQELFSYAPNRLSPAYRICKKAPLKIHELNFTHLSEELYEAELLTSFDHLMGFGPWLKKEPSLVAKLFHLPGQEVELQVCMPHFISDYNSIDIFFNELSSLYIQSCAKGFLQKTNDQEQFNTFLMKERINLDKQLERNLAFWKGYLQDADFFSFPPSFIIKDMSAEGYSYSTYREFPEQGLNHLQQYCAEQHVSLTDGLCATLGLALANCCNYNLNKSKSVLMGIVKSTRDNPIYDAKIGCFLRLDAIKVNLQGKPTIASLCKQIHQSTMETMPYQPCSGMAKLAAVGSLGQKKNGITNYILKKCIYLYTKLFRSLKLSYQLITLYLQLIPYWKNEDFFVYINLLTSFLPSEYKRKSHMFGLETNYPKLHKYDLSKINHVLEICFLRDENTNKPYLVVTANLKPAVRELIAEEMIRIIQNETLMS